MASKYEDLEEVYRKSYSIHDPLIFLHPDDDDRSYTEAEYDSLKERDFKTRWLICCTAIGGKCVALRSHWTDNHHFESHLKTVRNYFKASYVTHNATAAKSAVTELLSMFFRFENSQYYSFAVTVASGLSNYGENIAFEIDKELLEWNEEAQARRKLILLMDVLFSKMALYRFLIHDKGTNAYRLVHCRTVSSTNKGPIFYAIFCFLLQLCLTSYVVAEIITDYHDPDREDYRTWNVPLACLTTIYSAMIARSSMTDSADAMKLFQKRGPLQMIDRFVNKYLTSILLIAGFFVIVIQESFIEAVLNTAALLFIPDIDDQLPKLLGLNDQSIIKNYLSHNCLEEFDKVFEMTDERVKRELYKNRNKAIGIPFCDYYLTHIREQASCPKSGVIYTPYQVRPGDRRSGHQIDPSNFVTEHCLIKELEWRYTTGGRYVKSSRPRIGYLKIKLLGGNRETVVVKRKNLLKDDMRISEVKHKLEGIFIITSFQMSNDIIRLRVCGSPNARDFLNAFEYYSLWELSVNARNTLQKEAKKVKDGKRTLRNVDEGKKSFDEFDDDQYYTMNSNSWDSETGATKSSYLGKI